MIANAELLNPEAEEQTRIGQDIDISVNSADAVNAVVMELEAALENEQHELDQRHRELVEARSLKIEEMTRKAKDFANDVATKDAVKWKEAFASWGLTCDSEAEVRVAAEKVIVTVSVFSKKTQKKHSYSGSGEYYYEYEDRLTRDAQEFEFSQVGIQELAAEVRELDKRIADVNEKRMAVANQFADLPRTRDRLNGELSKSVLSSTKGGQRLLLALGSRIAKHMRPDARKLLENRLSEETELLLGPPEAADKKTAEKKPAKPRKKPRKVAK